VPWMPVLSSDRMRVIVALVVGAVLAVLPSLT
jgi:hypothetical protein